MSDFERPIVDDILSKIGEYEQSQREQEAEKRRAEAEGNMEAARANRQTQANLIKRQQLADLVREDARQVAGMLDERGVEANLAIPVASKLRYEFMFPRLASYGIRKWKRVEIPQPPRPAWLLALLESFTSTDQYFKGEYMGTTVSCGKRIGILLEQSGELTSMHVSHYKKDIDTNDVSRLLVGKTQVAEASQLVPLSCVNPDIALKEQPHLLMWRRQLGALGVAMLTSIPYSPLRLPIEDE